MLLGLQARLHFHEYAMETYRQLTMDEWDICVLDKKSAFKFFFSGAFFDKLQVASFLGHNERNCAQTTHFSDRPAHGANNAQLLSQSNSVDPCWNRTCWFCVWVS